PAGMYSILAHALAKDQAQRFHQPGAFANAYHNTTASINRTRVPFVVSESPAAQAHQSDVTEASQADAQFTEHAWTPNGSATSDQISRVSRSTTPFPNPPSMHGFSAEHPAIITDNPRPTLMRRFRNKGRQPFMLIASLILLLVIASSAVGITLLA